MDTCDGIKLNEIKNGKGNILIEIGDLTLREKCPNTEFFLVRIFLFSN